MLKGIFRSVSDLPVDELAAVFERPSLQEGYMHPVSVFLYEFSEFLFRHLMDYSFGSITSAQHADTVVEFEGHGSLASAAFGHEELYVAREVCVLPLLLPCLEILDVEVCLFFVVCLSVVSLLVIHCLLR